MKPSPFYQEGYDAARYGIEPLQNPYAVPWYAWEQWNDGFTSGIIDAAQADLPLIPQESDFCDYANTGDIGEIVDCDAGEIADCDIGEIADYGAPPPLWKLYQNRHLAG